ncbi:AEC family transporter [Brachybacterium sp. FME24]|uniref:AEC family transporter n=1 Tax=Brachybacterium sp. FME24 TaxID=2742605 RepID=UPI0018664BA5|nr:AEC family transporter [Brachybacterium sp. FME24]
MLGILSAIVPIFLIVALGYGVTRIGILRRADMRVLSTFVVKVALPALVFVNVVGRSPGEILNPTYLLTYAIAALVMVGLARLWNRTRRVGPVRAATLSLAVSGTNNGFVGFPIFLLLIPEVAGLAVGMDMMVDNILIIPLAIALFEAAAGRETSWGPRLVGTVRGVVTHPMVIAIAAALALTALGVGIPGIVDTALELVAGSSSAVALFSIGGMLVGMSLHGQRADLAAAVVAKLLVMPTVAVAVVLVLPLLGLPSLDPALRVAAILTCALPSMSMAAALGEQYGEGEFGASTMMLSTVLSFVTLSGWMLALSAVGWL